MMPFALIAQVATVCMFLFPDSQSLLLDKLLSEQDKRLKCFITIVACHEGSHFEKCAEEYILKQIKR